MKSGNWNNNKSLMFKYIKYKEGGEKKSFEANTI